MWSPNTINRKYLFLKTLYDNTLDINIVGLCETRITDDVTENDPGKKLRLNVKT